MICLKGETSYFLHPGSYTVGRKRTQDIPLSSVCVSREHALIQVESDFSVFIKDLSTDGTFVDDQRLPKGDFVAVQPFSQVRFATQGDHVFIIEPIVFNLLLSQSSAANPVVQSFTALTGATIYSSYTPEITHYVCNQFNFSSSGFWSLASGIPIISISFLNAILQKSNFSSFPDISKHLPPVHPSIQSTIISDQLLPNPDRCKVLQGVCVFVPSSWGRESIQLISALGGVVLEEGDPRCGEFSLHLKFEKKKMCCS
ncbi:hypothetical protein GEMRC1_008626 [Eukaryota sp. GEM-RC1]